MKISIRISNLNQLDDVLKLNPDAVGIGSETCVYKVPEYEEIKKAFIKLENAGIEAELITPFIPEEHLQRITDIVKNLINEKRKFSLTVNDLGLLRKLDKEVPDKKLDIYIGHVYSTSFENCPWHEKVLSEESDFIREGWCQNNFTNDLLLEYIKKQGVTGIEIEMLPTMLNKSALFFRDRNIKTKGMIDYIPSSITRACHTARYYGALPPGECQDYCDKVINARFTHRYIPDDLEKPYEPINEELIRPLTPDYLVLGNSVCCKRECDVNKQNINNVDYITFDFRAFKYDELASRIAELRKIANEE